jgi:hypothetical protein
MKTVKLRSNQMHYFYYLKLKSKTKVKKLKTIFSVSKRYIVNSFKF